jgi:hypothetical protein
MHVLEEAELLTIILVGTAQCAAPARVPDERDCAPLGQLGPASYGTLTWPCA